MKRRLLAPLLCMGLGALGLAFPGEPPGTVAQLCQRYCAGQLVAVPTGGLSACTTSGDYLEGCTGACEEDIGTMREACHTPLVQAYGCGADHSWFCVPKEDGGHVLTQFDTCRAQWNALYACEQGSPDAGTP